MTTIVELNVKSVEVKQPEPKPIELRRYVNQYHEKIGTAGCDASDFDFITLISKGGSTHYDMILCWDEDNENDKMMYLGYWNDGVVG